MYTMKTIRFDERGRVYVKWINNDTGASIIRDVALHMLYAASARLVDMGEGTGSIDVADLLGKEYSKEEIAQT